MTGPSPRLSLFETPTVSDDPRAAFEQVLSNAAYAEELGFDGYWLAEAHFAVIGSPSALTLLTAASQRTNRIRLGTAVIPLAFDNPLRLAETAAVVDVLSGGRLELGVGKGNPGGFSATAYRAFGVDEQDRDAVFAHGLDELRAAFAHAETGSNGRVFPFYPPRPDLPGRIWQATGSDLTARAAARAGDGIQLYRVVLGQDTGRVQQALVEAYLDALPSGVQPRIGVSRAILPARDRDEARDVFAAHLRAHPHALLGLEPDGASTEQILSALHILHGSPDDIVEQVAQDATASAATDLLVSIPLAHDDPHYRVALATVAGQIHPRLPAPARLPQHLPVG